MEITAMTFVSLCGGFVLGIIVAGYIFQWLIDSAAFKWDRRGLPERILHFVQKIRGGSAR